MNFPLEFASLASTDMSFDGCPVRNLSFRRWCHVSTIQGDQDFDIPAECGFGEEVETLESSSVTSFPMERRLADQGFAKMVASARHSSEAFFWTDDNEDASPILIILRQVFTRGRFFLSFSSPWSAKGVFFHVQWPFIIRDDPIDPSFRTFRFPSLTSQQQKKPSVFIVDVGGPVAGNARSTHSLAKPLSINREKHKNFCRNSGCSGEPLRL